MLDGVEWVNDSKATNVDSVLVACGPSRAAVAHRRGQGYKAPYAPMVEAGQGR